jgi:hypothetical protein
MAGPQVRFLQESWYLHFLQMLLRVIGLINVSEFHSKFPSVQIPSTSINTDELINWPIGMTGFFFLLEINENLCIHCVFLHMFN